MVHHPFDYRAEAIGPYGDTTDSYVCGDEGGKTTFPQVSCII